MASNTREPGRQAPAARWSARRRDTLLVAAGLVTGVLIVREMREPVVDRGIPQASVTTAEVPMAMEREPSPLRTPPAQFEDGHSGVAVVGSDHADVTSLRGDNSSEIDGAPPVPVEADGALYVPPPVGSRLAPEHMPEPPAQTRLPAGPQDVAAIRSRVESLLAADPEALQQARALLDEADPEARARNLEILADSFGLE